MEPEMTEEKFNQILNGKGWSANDIRYDIYKLGIPMCIFEIFYQAGYKEGATK